MPRIIRRLVAWCRRGRLDDDLRDELAQHVAWKTQALIDEGVPEIEARRRARVAVGNVTRLKEEARDMWGFPALDTIVQDLRYGTRLLRRSPAFSAVAILSLAIGIGSSAAVFSLADTVLLRKLAVADPDGLVVFKWFSGPAFPFSSLNGYGEQNETGLASTSFSATALDAFQREGARYVDVAPFADLYQVNLAVDGHGDVGAAHAVGGRYFDVLGVSPEAGRTLLPSDDREGAEPAVVISHAFWMRRFAGAPDAIGRTVAVNAAPFTIAGVLPKAFHGTGQAGTDPDVYLPIALRTLAVPDDDPPSDPNFWWVLMLGRLKPGVRVEDARAALDVLLKRTVAAAKPDLATKDLPRLALLPGAHGQMEEREHMADILRAMGIVTGIVLLIACANVANLLLARGRARVRELAVRVAIGAPRGRVIRQLFTEAALVAGAGSALGILIAAPVARLLLPALGEGPPVLASLAVNGRLLAFVVLAASASAILFGLVPAFRATDVRLAAGLEEGRRGMTGRRRRGALTGGLVAVQIALSVLLVAAAGLLVRSVRNLERVDLGFDPGNVLLFQLDAARNGYDAARVQALYTTVLERLRAAPGVRSASLSSHRLISNSSSFGAASRLDEAVPPRRAQEFRAFARTHGAYHLVVDEQFFATFAIPIVRGRTFAPADSQGESVAVVDRALAQQLFGMEDAVGRQFRTNRGMHRIVGVCADARLASLRRPMGPTAYLYYLHGPDPKHAATFGVKTTGPPAALAATARQIVRDLDPTLPVARVGTQAEQVAASVGPERLFARLASLLGLVALALSAIGLHALLAYTVTQRTPEIGVRLALGARQAALRWMILKQSLALAAVGLVAGVAAAAAGSRTLESLLYGLPPRDPMTLGGAVAVMLVVSSVAAYLPARRASRIDPIVALRAE